MITNVSEAEICDAAAYNDWHVPALFEQWAPRVADATGIRSGDHVLDVACGTGVLAREAATRVGNSGSVSGLDPAGGMLTVAQQLDQTIEWRQGVAESLPYDDCSFDRVISQFGLMFFQDRTAALNEMLRVLKPQGTMAIAVWNSLESSMPYTLAVEMLEELAGSDASAALKAPFVLGDTDELYALFQQSSAEAIQVSTHIGKARFPSIKSMVEADLRGWLPVMGVHLDEDLIQSILIRAETVLAQYISQDGTVIFDTQAHIITARKLS